MALILSGDTGVPASGMPTGSVIQTVQGTYTGYQQTSSQTFVSFPLSATITPISSSSKILVLVNTMTAGSSNTGVGLAIYRNSTPVWNSGYDGGPKYYNVYVASGYNIGQALTYLDSPATTSATTYTLYFSSYASGVTVNVGVANTTHTIQLQEIHG